MNFRRCKAVFALALMAAAVAVPAQTLEAPDAKPQAENPAPAAVSPVDAAVPARIAGKSTADELLDFSDSDVKFDLRDLMELLRDRRHEGWVLAAYPDPKTGRPLIGAGFSLDLPERDHPQRDPLNPHPFLEPSSADLWRIAGLDPKRLQSILEEYNRKLAVWKKKRFRKRIPALEPQITEDEANALLRVAALQAIFNAKAYCRNFDRYTASQQMAITQLVYQMGVNLGEFSQFLNLINSDSIAEEETDEAENAEADYWNAVQASLIQSQWARLYRGRAVAVIAMLEPRYSDAPVQAERAVSVALRPAAVYRRRGGQSGSLRKAAYGERALRRGSHRKRLHPRSN